MTKSFEKEDRLTPALSISSSTTPVLLIFNPFDLCSSVLEPSLYLGLGQLHIVRMIRMVMIIIIIRMMIIDHHHRNQNGDDDKVMIQIVNKIVAT